MKAWLRDVMRDVMRGVIGFAVVLWLTGCTGIPVDTDYDPDYTLSLTSSYAWMETAKTQRDPIVENDLLTGRVHRAVDEQLAAQGLHLAASGQQPDLLVTFHAGEAEKMDIDSSDRFFGYYGYYPCWHCWGPSPFYNDVTVSYYTEGTLTVDIVDAKTKRLVWRGVADRRIPKFKSPQERDAFVRESVAAIFQYFPPGHKPQR